MSHVLVGLGIVALTFVIAGFGVYSHIDSSMTAARTSLLVGNLERQVAAVQDFMNDRGAVPTSAELGNVVADQFTRPSTADVTFSYAVVSGQGYACAAVAASSSGWQSAFDKVVATRPAWFSSGACGNSSTAVATTRYLSAGI